MQHPDYRDKMTLEERITLTFLQVRPPFPLISPRSVQPEHALIQTTCTGRSTCAFPGRHPAVWLDCVRRADAVSRQPCATILCCAKDIPHHCAPWVRLLSINIYSYTDSLSSSHRDTKILLCNKHTGKVEPLTEKHHAESRVETTRLRRLGGQLITDSFGESR